jgi:hypothetical protein
VWEGEMSQPQQILHIANDFVPAAKEDRQKRTRWSLSQDNPWKKKKLKQKTLMYRSASQPHVGGEGM